MVETKYKPEYCDDLINFFSVEPFRTEYTVSPKGLPIVIKVPLPLPTFAAWAAKIKVSPKTILGWANQFDDFGSAVEICKAMQENMLFNNGLQGLYNPSVTIFGLKNLAGWTDKIESKVEANLTMDSLFKRVMSNNEGIDFIQQKNMAIEDAEVLTISSPNTKLANELKSFHKDSIRELAGVED